MDKKTTQLLLIYLLVIKFNEKETENFDVESKLNDYVKDTELKAIEDAVKVSATRVEAAKKLGISPRTLRYKIAKFKESGFEVAL